MSKKDTLLRNARYLSADGTVEHGDIWIVDGKIHKIAEHIDVEGSHPTVYHLAGDMVLPGFVNTHTHVAMTLLRGYGGNVDLHTWLNQYIWPAEAKMTDFSIKVGTELALLELFRTGTTTFNDMYDHMDVVAEVVRDAGARAMLSRGMIGIAPNASQALEENNQLYDRWHHQAEGRIRVAYGPHAPYTCTPEFLQRVCAEAKKRQAPIHIHLSETATEVDDIQKAYGVSPVALLDDLGVFDQPTIAAHCVWLSQDDIERLARKKVAVAHNPASNMKLASGIAPICALRSKGITVGIGTDGPSSNNRMDMWRDMNLATLLQKVETLDATVLSAKDVLHMATLEGAKALLWEDTIGSLEVGKAADLMVVDTQSEAFAAGHDILEDLIYGTTGDAVRLTMVAGQIVYKENTWLTLDRERILFDAKNEAKRLVQNI